MRLLFLLIVSFGVCLTANGQMEFVSSAAEEYRWTVNGEPKENLKTLLRSVEYEESLLCKKRLPLDSVLAAVAKMEQSGLEADRKVVEKLADRLFDTYRTIRNNGCYKPQHFFSEEEVLFPRKKRSKKIIDNPVLRALENQLHRYRMIQKRGGWQKIVLRDTLYLYPSKSYDEIPQIKRRLAIEGFYEGVVDNNTTYDAELERAVKSFQRHHALKPDGIIGPATLDALNVSVDEKIERIMINIERFRWFVQDTDYFVLVNIPGFFLEVFEQGRPIFHSKVVVGRKERPSPLMQDNIAYAVFNPYWRAPKTIIEKDILPHLKKGEFAYLHKKGIQISTDYRGRHLVPMEEIEWRFFENAEDIPFYFFQEPGPHNFLGYLKLIFPNRFDVYLHDTNHRSVFTYTYRALSSGCIRVEKPIELFHLLKSKEQELTYRDIFDIIWSKKRTKILFRKKIPIYLAYLSVYVDEKGAIYFYDDIYGYDKRMEKVLKRMNNG